MNKKKTKNTIVVLALCGAALAAVAGVAIPAVGACKGEISAERTAATSKN